MQGFDLDSFSESTTRTDFFSFQCINLESYFSKVKIIKAGRFCVGVLLPPAKRSTDFMIFGILFTYPVSLGFFFLHCESSN